MSKKDYLTNLSIDSTGTLCNFNFRVIKWLKVISNGKEDFVSVELHFDNGIIHNATLPLSNLEQINWSDIDQRCILFKNTKCTKEKIANIIRSQITEDIPQEEQLSVDTVGFIRYNGSIGFVLGEEVITFSSDNQFPICILNKVPINLEYDPALSSYDTFNGMIEIVSLFPGGGWVLLDHTLSGIMREAFVTAGFIPELEKGFIEEEVAIKSYINFERYIIKLINA